MGGRTRQNRGMSEVLMRPLIGFAPESSEHVALLRPMMMECDNNTAEAVRRMGVLFRVHVTVEQGADAERLYLHHVSATPADMRQYAWAETEDGILNVRALALRLATRALTALNEKFGKEIKKPCPNCWGSGQHSGATCLRCSGDGVILESRDYGPRELRE